MQCVDGLLSLRAGTVDGADILSPMRSHFNWNDGICTSSCSKQTCADGHPGLDCRCGIYSVLDNGLHELANYVQNSNQIVFVGWAFSTVHIYDWGVRSGQWVAVGVVNWHGFSDKVISPAHFHESWWDSAYSALDVLRTRQVDKPKLYELDMVSVAIQQQIDLREQRNVAFNQLFGIQQQENNV